MGALSLGLAGVLFFYSDGLFGLSLILGRSILIRKLVLTKFDPRICFN